MEKNNKKIVYAVIALIAAIAVFAVLFCIFRQKPEPTSENTSSEVSTEVQSSEASSEAQKSEVSEDAQSSEAESSEESSEEITVTGAKSVVIVVVNSEGAEASYDVKTDADYLRQAMEEAEGLEFTGTESAYGLMVETVNGETASWDVDQSYWAFYVNDEYCNYGVDSQPVNDGDTFKIVYTK